MAMSETKDPLLQEIIGPTPGQMLRKRVFGHQGLLIGAVVLGLLLFVAIFAPLLAPHDPYAQSLMNRMQPPVFLGGSWEHPLGTDHLGRDYLSRLIYGARVSLMIGAIAALISGVIGTAMGVAAGYFGGARGHGCHVPHQCAPCDAGGAGGAGGGGHSGRVAAGGDRGAGAVAVGPLRGGHAGLDLAGAGA
jgi:hypothetical protein